MKNFKHPGTRTIKLAGIAALEKNALNSTFDRNKMKALIKTPFLFLLVTIFITTSCGLRSDSAKKTIFTTDSSAVNQSVVKNYKVTFIELGSVRCIPCKQMQVVMKSIEAKYSKEVKIDFYDVWTEEGKPFGLKYGIESIPTQIFLDETGKEYYRHAGYFPEDELIQILKIKGVKLN